MSISSQIFFGYYIKAKCTTAKQVDPVHQCSTDASHGLPRDIPKFCPHCGGRVIELEGEWDIQRTLCGIQWEGENYDWIQKLSPEDIDWINENFSVHDTSYINGENGYDYIMCGDWQGIDGLENAVIPMSVDDLTTPPTTEDTKRLQTIMQYETVELLFGALVAVSG